MAESSKLTAEQVYTMSRKEMKDAVGRLAAAMSDEDLEDALNDHITNGLKKKLGRRWQREAKGGYEG